MAEAPLARRIFRGAAIWGFIVLPPLYLVPLPQVGAETFLGFVGCALVFQAVFWIIGGDPVKYRALMLPAVFEKLVFGVPATVLFAQGRVLPVVAFFAAVDLLLAVLFLIARRATPR
ncbi:hypothetical protein OLX02_15445 [Novosphingobium sp. KCTC 2891]|uniref:hypothetical protein n=1 Tax=Novosphingobium sp. KCTC 2891 TaxID=2989730 RepID=UPI0022237E20|nr:hypothetical protein [Novosphingobium sp. KCTC 2891]MCW1384218.1 hypothetical protein [Novosphingobium sp. KCTC 2891]